MTRTEEEWRAVVGFEGIYEVSSNGRVKSLGRERTLFGDLNRRMMTKDHILAGRIDGAGYKKVCLVRDGVHKYINVHRLVAEAFIQNPLKLRDVNHKNGVKIDNRLDNLEWVSHSENIKHSYIVLGRKRNDWTNKKVKCLNTGDTFKSVKEASLSCGVSAGSISNCLHGRVKNTKGLLWEYA